MNRAANAVSPGDPVAARPADNPAVVANAAARATAVVEVAPAGGVAIAEAVRARSTSGPAMLYFAGWAKSTQTGEPTSAD